MRQSICRRSAASLDPVKSETVAASASTLHSAAHCIIRRARALRLAGTAVSQSESREVGSFDTIVLANIVDVHVREGVPQGTL